ncbi:ion transporter [Methanomethylovorans sp.]|uniref:ion transporter n=1 Tax=Methanomethylovorans sp. TaxID=2758717 RepID=UPI00351C4B15
MATFFREKENRPAGPEWRKRLYNVIFEADTNAGKYFDILLIASILLSVIVVMLDSVSSLRNTHGSVLHGLEWFFTILFTMEYLLRLMCVRSKMAYSTSFFGIVDIISIIPTYISLILPGSQFLLVIRVLRVLRIFRVFKLVQYITEAELLLKALRASSRKIIIFLFTVLTMVVIMGSLMYLIEGEENGFTSIPSGIYWAIVTITTVGFGDIVPQTPLGRALASFVMILGYSIIAVPTGIVTSEMSLVSMEERKKKRKRLTCSKCGHDDHDEDACFCKYCGVRI